MRVRLRGLAVLASLSLGAAYGLTNPAASLVLQRWAPPARRALVFFIKQTRVPLGEMTAGLLLPGLAGALGWRGAILAAAALAIAA